MRNGFVTGDALEALCMKHFKREGYTLERARASLHWSGAKGRCGRCRTFHPQCGAKPRSMANDFFGVVDLIGFRWPSTAYGYLDTWIVVQCGPSSLAAKKRNDLGRHRWPPGTRAVVITPDSRVDAVPGRYRTWDRTAEGWREGTVEL